MPVKFVVQKRLKSADVKRSVRLDMDWNGNKLSNRVWVDTMWSTLAEARHWHPEWEYREVMLEW